MEITRQPQEETGPHPTPITKKNHRRKMIPEGTTRQAAWETQTGLHYARQPVEADVEGQYDVQARIGHPVTHPHQENQRNHRAVTILPHTEEDVTTPENRHGAESACQGITAATIERTQPPGRPPPNPGILSPLGD